MNTALMIYLYLAVGSLLDMLFLACVGLGAVVGASGLAILEEQTNGHAPPEGYGKWAKRYLICAACFLVVDSFYPDKEDLAFIFGGAIAVDIATTEEAQKLPDNLLKAANSFLEGVYTEEDAL